MKIIYALFLMFSIDSFATEGLGAEVEQYPTGTIVQAVLRTDWNSQSEWDALAGVNFVYHGDQGLQNRESGLGLGGVLRWRRFVPAIWQTTFFGLSAAVWRTEIHWQNTKDANLPPSGTTELWVFQPTAEIGHDFKWDSKNTNVSVSLQFGYEINVIVQGAHTGQGPIGLLTAALTF
jgi:hypothetical protein